MQRENRGKQRQDRGYEEARTFIVKGNRSDSCPTAACSEAVLQVREARLLCQLCRGKKPVCG